MFLNVVVPVLSLNTDCHDPVPNPYQVPDRGSRTIHGSGKSTASSGVLLLLPLLVLPPLVVLLPLLELLPLAPSSGAAVVWPGTRRGIASNVVNENNTQVGINIGITVVNSGVQQYGHG